MFAAQRVGIQISEVYYQRVHGKKRSKASQISARDEWLAQRKSPLKVCYILSYYFPDYVRSQTLRMALKRLEDVVLFEAVNSLQGPLRYLQSLLKLLVIRLVHNPDWYILGFRGYEFYWLVRLLTLGKPLIIDHLMSPYDSLVNEKKHIKPGGGLDRLVYLYEKSLLQNADFILTDTLLHKDYFADLFSLNANKIFAVYVSSNEDLFVRQSESEPKKDAREEFIVFFYGSFLPLHGVDVILEAAGLLKRLPIHFCLIGGHKTDLTKFNFEVKRLKLENLTHREWVDYRHLPGYIASADLCLGGPFGDTGQSNRIVTGKSFQFLSMGKPTVVGKIPHDHGFIDKENCLLVAQGNATALAETIQWAYENQSLLPSIGMQGYELYQYKFSIDSLKKDLGEILVDSLNQ